MCIRDRRVTAPEFCGALRHAAQRTQLALPQPGRGGGEETEGLPFAGELLHCVKVAGFFLRRKETPSYSEETAQPGEQCGDGGTHRIPDNAPFPYGKTDDQEQEDNKNPIRISTCVFPVKGHHFPVSYTHLAARKAKAPDHRRSHTDKGTFLFQERPFFHAAHH